MNNTEINKSPEAAPKLGVVAGSLQSSEEYFADRDAFVAYVLDEVNPARAAEGLSTVSHGAASRLYDIVKSQAYLKLENVAVSNAMNGFNTQTGTSNRVAL